MASTFIEQDCTFTHGGHTAMASGAVVTPTALIAYLGKHGVLTTWHGAPMGTYRITASWRTPRSHVSSYMHQVEACVDGIVYTGRSAGIGMAYRGKVKR